MLKAIAIDDEPIALEVIKNLSAKISFIELLDCFTDAFKAIDFLQKEKADLIFLDIKMPDISGIDFLKSITNPPMVIFTTAYSEHAVQSFELDAIDYLLKPFSQSRFFKACNKAYEQHKFKNNTSNQSSPGSIFIKSGYEQIRIQLDEILYVESNGNYMQFVLPNRKILSRLTMNEAEELLPKLSFVRIHRSYIAAAARITRVEKSMVWINQTQLPVGAAYLHEIEKITKPE
jgi:two-component system, LytTR family, response regulator